MTARLRIDYDAGLVEAAVLLAERGLARADAVRFRAQRDRIYESGEGDEREARFEELHGRFFVQLGLDRPLHVALADHPGMLRRVGGCRALRAIARHDEGADLVDDLAPDLDPGRRLPVLVLRLRPESLVDPVRLGPFLRRELRHVADMLDPGFGYERELPTNDHDPARANRLRERYRAVWAVSVDGRLGDRGGLPRQALAVRCSEFARLFPALGTGVEGAIEYWLGEPRPSHRAILDFIRVAAPEA